MLRTIEDRKIDGVTLELTSFYDHDDEYGKRDPDQVIGELRSDLLPDEEGTRG